MFVILAHNWWMLLLRGILALLFGLFCFLYPEITLDLLTIAFGIYAFLDGVLAIGSAISAAVGQSWWVTIIEGIFGILVGLLCITLLLRDMSAFGLLYLMAVWAITTGILKVAAAIELRRYFTNEWLLLLSGAASLVFALLLVVMYRAGALAVIFWIGTCGIACGLSLIGLAFELLSYRRTRREMELPTG